MKTILQHIYATLLPHVLTRFRVLIHYQKSRKITSRGILLERLSKYILTQMKAIKIFLEWRFDVIFTSSSIKVRYYSCVHLLRVHISWTLEVITNFNWIWRWCKDDLETSFYNKINYLSLSFVSRGILVWNLVWTYRSTYRSYDIALSQKYHKIKAVQIFYVYHDITIVCKFCMILIIQVWMQYKCRWTNNLANSFGYLKKHTQSRAIGSCPSGNNYHD